MTLRRYLGAHQQTVLQAWHEEVRQAVGSARSIEALMPSDTPGALLGLISSALGADESGVATEPPEFDPTGTVASRHGRSIQRQGATSAELARQFAILRAVVLRLWREQADAEGEALEEVLRFNAAIDQVLGWALESYSKAAAQTRETFLAVVGHDLRSPLGSLAGCLELLENPDLPAERRQRSAQIARRSVRTIEGMVNDLLEYTRTRLGQSIQVQPSVADLGELCREAVEDAQAAFPRSAFTINVPESLPAFFDVARMRQVLANLLGNAVHHGAPGTAIVLEARAGAEALTVEVTNLGPPIPAELMQTIFDPLVQVPVASPEHRQRPATSLGLGLFIAREIVLAHGGRIDAASSAEAGTRFTVMLPRTAPAGGQAGDLPGSEVAQAPAHSDADGHGTSLSPPLNRPPA